MSSIIIVGAGIAGASLSFQAARAGWAVTVVDSGAGQASSVPVALINPVRGQGGRVPARALEGMAHTWALLDELAALGHPVPHGKTGVFRPIPDEKTHRKWQAALPADLPHHWLAPQEVAALAGAWHAVLWLPQAGWLSGAGFVRALLAASGAAVVRGTVGEWSARQVTLTTGQTLGADVVVNCTGAAGAPAGEGVHRAGSLLLLRGVARALPGGVPRSYGVYLSPAAGRVGVLGGTFEAPQSSYAAALGLGLPLHSLGWLLQKGAALADPAALQITGQWTGVRLSGLEVSTQPDSAGVYHLRGLGSKGFLLGPLLARDLLEGLH